jgi:REP element-mobilizing transposase RayT
MSNTLGYHFVKSAYGQWLPGDERGSWSEVWDSRIGFIEPHMLHPGDPARLLIAEERKKHDPVLLSESMIQAVIETLTECIQESAGGLSIVAAAIEPTHAHLLIPYSGWNIDNTTKWLADQTTKKIHRRTSHTGPVWGKGKWCAHVFEEDYWYQIIEYIERHNVRRGRGMRPYPFLTARVDGY